MKNNKLLIIPAFLVLASLASCGKETKKVSVGLGYSAAYQLVDSYDESKFKNQLEVTAAAVGFDEEDKIVDARFDCVQIKYAATEGEGGTFTYSTPSAKNDRGVKSKLELGKDYNMKPASPTGVEVDLQMESLADFCIGKTVAEVKAATSVPGVTIYTGAYIEALEKAFAVKRAAVEYEGELKAGVGIAGGLFSTTDHNEHEAQVTLNASLVADSKVVASYTDCVVYQVKDAVKVGDQIKLEGVDPQKYVVNGKITSKFDLGTDYGMAQYGPTGAIEWNEQGKAFDTAIAGKTADEVKTAASFAGVTMYAGDLVNAAYESITYSALEHVGPQW